MTIPIVDNYLEHWELRRWESKITKTTVTLCDKVEEKNTPRPSASTPGYKPDRIPARGHREPGLVKAALPRGQRKKKKTSLEATQISAAAEWIHKLWSIHGTECYTVVKRMTCCLHRVDSLGTSCKGKKAEGRRLHTEWPNYLKIKITQNWTMPCWGQCHACGKTIKSSRRMIHGQKLRPGIASRENGQGMGPGRVNRGPQVQCTFLNWVPQVHLGFLVVTAYNSCILINALLWVPLLSSASISQRMWFMRSQGFAVKGNRARSRWLKGRMGSGWRCPWGVGGRGGHQVHGL